MRAREAGREPLVSPSIAGAPPPGDRPCSVWDYRRAGEIASVLLQGAQAVDPLEPIVTTT